MKKVLNSKVDEINQIIQVYVEKLKVAELKFDNEDQGWIPTIVKVA